MDQRNSARVIARKDPDKDRDCAHYVIAGFKDPSDERTR